MLLASCASEKPCLVSCAFGSCFLFYSICAFRQNHVGILIPPSSCAFILECTCFLYLCLQWYGFVPIFHTFPHGTIKSQLHELHQLCFVIGIREVRIQFSNRITNHRIVCIGRTFKVLLQHSCPGQGHLPLDHATQSPIQPNIKHFQ